MLLAVVITISFILIDLDWSMADAVRNIADSEYSKVFINDPSKGNYFWKHFLAGMFITIVMTGLDQDMMQKNLTCKNLKEAKKNVYSMSIALVPVNLLFLALGALLYLYGIEKGFLDFTTNPELIKAGKVLTLTDPNGVVGVFKRDELFPFLSFNYLPIAAALTFIIGLTAAAYSSADSALTSLTTSFYIDILGKDENDKSTKTRKLVHIGFSIVLILVILLFDALNNQSVINELFKLAGYTYGPLLGLFAFGLVTKIKVKDGLVPMVAILAPILTYILAANSESWFGYKFGFELLIANGILTFLGLVILSFIKKDKLEIIDN